MINIGLKKSRKAKLIYDSHSLLSRAKKRLGSRFFLSHLERFLMKRCVLSIVLTTASQVSYSKSMVENRPTVVGVRRN